MIVNWLRKKMFARADKRLALKHPPLRVPAQSLAARFEEKLMDWFFTVMFAPLLTVLLAVLYAFAIRHGANINLSLTVPVLLVGIVGVALVAMRIARRHRTEVQNLYLGMLAERYVGQQLERSRYLGFSVFHDITDDADGRTFNIDHIAIGEQGIFVVEAKGKSKPLKGRTEVEFDGERLSFSDGTFTDDPVRQTEANMNYVRDLLFRLLTEQRNPICEFRNAGQLPVTGMIVYPGWFVKRDGFPKKDLVVTTDKPMLRYLQRCRKILSKQEAKELGDLLGNYLRNERRDMLLQ